MIEEPRRWWQRTWIPVVIFVLAALSIALQLPEIPAAASQGRWLDIAFGSFRSLLYIALGVLFLWVRSRAKRDDAGRPTKPTDTP